MKNRMPAKITNLRQFILFCDTHDDDTIYDMFEYNCSENVRNRVYSFATPGSPEPFRSAMINLGFSDFSC